MPVFDPRTPRQVSVAAPSRLHFGMFSFGDSGRRRFGGVGAMIESPSVRLKLGAATEFSVSGPSRERVEQAARRWAQAEGLGEPPACQVEVIEAPPFHVGLGVGTQISLAVAAGMRAWLGWPDQDSASLAIKVGRGERSAIGVHGFGRGGLLVEAGKLAERAISPLVARAELPTDWRFLLIRPPGNEGVSGAAERAAFERLPAIPAATSAAMCRETLLELLPAALEANFDRFADSLSRFGELAGSCFKPVQGGIFSSPRVASVVDAARQIGARGVGQSSWGPTVFALAPDEGAAIRFLADLRSLSEFSDLETRIARPNSLGANVWVSSTSRS